MVTYGLGIGSGLSWRRHRVSIYQGIKRRRSVKEGLLHFSLLIIHGTSRTEAIVILFWA